jgi:glutathione S-transferase
MLALYHGGTSVASAKVRLALAEKGVAFESRLLDLRRGEQKRGEYLALNPAGVVPTLMHDGRVIVESSIILEYVEETWPSPALMPRVPGRRAEVRLWLRRVDELHDACSVLSSSVKLAAMRGDADAIEKMLARTPDPAKRLRQQRLVEQGFAAPDIASAIAHYAGFLAQADQALEHAAWLSGDALGLADCAALPYVHRLACLGMEALWSQSPAIVNWFARLRARASFDAAITRWNGAQAYQPSAELAELAGAYPGLAQPAP